MSGLKELRNRIASVGATRKITRAMQMVAASKLRRAQEDLMNARPFADEMRAMTARLAQEKDAGEGGGLARRMVEKGGAPHDVLFVVASGLRGLCGGFNSAILRLARARARALAEGGRKVLVLPMGRKAGEMMRREKSAEIVDLIEVGQTRHAMREASEDAAERIVSLFEEGAFGRCLFFHAVFESVLTQRPVERALIPIEEGEKTSASGGEGVFSAPSGAEGVYEYEPEGSQILEHLLRRNLSAQLYLGLLENAAGEQGARMTAMDNATRNADDMMDDLSVRYNRTRQAMITRELVEIISGAEAL